MARRKTPWLDDNFVYFELQTPLFEAFDPQNKGGVYSVPNFEPGIYRIPIAAIREATSEDRRKRRSLLFSVDVCQVFLVDTSRVAEIRAKLDAKESVTPDYAYLEGLRRKVGIDFGFAVINADGSYILDLSQLERVPKGMKARPKKVNAGREDLYEKVARRMRTFICERCFKEELMEPAAAGPTLLAHLAKEQGWQLLPHSGKRETWFFDEFQVVGPTCAAKS